MPNLVAPIGSDLYAVLGPTNTGKTHRCIERMLDFPSGMMGLPLRLLAREVYDRISAQIGEERVALVTGEEKRVPKHPAYWVCTVEAMPLDVDVDFLAVDEVQLMAHPTRGHVFTDRVLHARGRQETWFLGSDAVGQLLAHLVPSAKQRSFPRLSRLSYAGQHSLGKLPKRSAVVAFSLPQVYELAERLRAQKGGAAVVLGALSPRTRNAQVAMYQAGEVDYLVATDAIGMGLNLRLDHVAFAGLRKFDGRQSRELNPRELAQIAGRAGRYHSDGTFGTLAPGAALPESVVQAIELHRFEAQRLASWRNSDLDLSSLGALLQSLALPPKQAALRLFDQASDALALQHLARKDWVGSACRSEEQVRLLWQLCQVPDYRQLLPEVHAELLGEIFERLLTHGGVLDDDWLEQRVKPLDNTSGDIDALLGRIAFVRTWTYLSEQPGLVRAKATWQERTRGIEDRLSDALHEQLVQRFVEKTQKPRWLPLSLNAATAKGAVVSTKAPRSKPSVSLREPHPSPFAQLLALKLQESAEALAPSAEAWLEAALAAPHEQLVLRRGGHISYRDQDLGRLSQGKSLLHPEVTLTRHAIGAGDEARLRRRLTAFARDLITQLKGRWYAEQDLSAAERGLLYQLLLNLGTLLRSEALPQITALGTDATARLAARGIHIGLRLVWVSSLLRPETLLIRQALFETFHGQSLPLDFSTAQVSLLNESSGRLKQPSKLLALGYYPAASRYVRCDMLERVLLELRQERPDPGKVCTLLGCKKAELPHVLHALGHARAPTTTKRLKSRRQRVAQTSSGTTPTEAQKEIPRDVSSR